VVAAELHAGRNRRRFSVALVLTKVVVFLVDTI
jgi:hypothetical protein